MKQIAFSGYHPAVTLVYFLLVLLCTMCLMHPAVLGLSLLGALCLAGLCKGARVVARQMVYLLPLIGFTAFANALLVREGETVWFRLFGRFPLTVESAIYGLAAGSMLAATFLWLSSFNKIMSTDKLLFLFAGRAPHLALLLTMSLGFLPKLRRQWRQVATAQAGVGRSLHHGSLGQRFENSAAILSVMLTWSLEQAADTADSMKSRGYGLPNPSSFSRYHLEQRDIALLLFSLLCGGLIAVGWRFSGLGWSFYPRFFVDIRQSNALLLTSYALLCAAPHFLQRKEARLWPSSK